MGRKLSCCLLLIVIITLILCKETSTSKVVSGVKSVSIVFSKDRWFQPPKRIVALNDVTVDFADGITAFCGSSGSGKSTLAKVVHGLYDRKDFVGDIVISEDSLQPTPTVYLDPFAYLTYDSTKSVGYYIKTGDVAMQNDCLFHEKIYNSFGVAGDTVINNLLESQRMFFEVTLLFSRLQERRDQTSGLLILDEYLDKVVPSVRNVFMTKIRELVNNEEMSFQVIIVTHSKAVCNICDTVIALKNGMVYSEGVPGKVMKYLPAEFVLLK